MTRVIAFGVFDPLHEGHKDFFRQAKALGDHLLVIVARDSSIRTHKGRDPFQVEEERLAVVASTPLVNEAQLGNKTAHQYTLLGELDFDVVALGYDQAPSDEEVRHELAARGKHQVRVVRLEAFKPELYKSSRLRK